ncbi:amino acid adenylation domain-containing protein [Marininema mesophilum]|uniref:Amino acid adenylation domain-containing protein n=1 Tax=Marininema mesophilum TaxID=1048340 RepID=A0A1H3ATW7_9BACL|nr:amino acid adenylation domain-containing protein [Marininema mesophilum]SDX33170.1 amino acid adenylation domain-containing protein [Marininema mesophilum]
MKKSQSFYERLNQLPAEKRALITRKLRAGGERSSTSIPNYSNRSLVAVSYAQKRLWFLDQLESTDSTSYNMIAVWKMEGRLSPSVLQRSIYEIIKRHDSLRTIFVTTPDGVSQKIDPSIEPYYKWYEIHQGTFEERRAEALELAKKESKHRFDLTIGPLVRTKVIQIDEQNHLLVLNMHHIISDGWSMGVFIRELVALYEAYSNEQSSPLPALPIQYTDFSRWQQEYLQGEVMDQQVKYWKSQLSGELPVLKLTIGRQRKDRSSFKGDVLLYKLPQGLLQRLTKWSVDENVTLFITLLAAFNTLLYRYSGQEDIIVGTPISGRNRSEVEGLIGFFVNTLPIRSDLSGDPSFQQLVERVKSTFSGAYEHQDLPFERIVAEVNPERDASQSPLFRVMFALQNAPMPPMKLPHLSLEPVDIYNNSAKFDLFFSLTEETDGLACMIEYSTELFEEETIQRMIQHYEVILEAVCCQPYKPIAQIPMLTEEEKKQILVDWNPVRETTDSPMCLHTSFAEQVKLQPYATAVVVGERRYSYRDLDDQAEKLAWYLQKRGVGPGALVGVCVERSFHMFVSMLGVLKAGGAYVPLDPTYPEERLTYILQDTQAKWIVTQSSLEDRVPRINEVEMIKLDAREIQEIEQSTIDLKSGVNGDDLAYIIYTSGSTGNPKGVMIRHRNAFALIQWSREVYTSEQIDGVLASTSICFDLSVFEIFVPLCRGGKVILTQNAIYLPELPYAHEVKLINTVPSAITELLRVEGIPHSVRTVNLAGEPLKGQLVERLYQQNGIEKVYNLYGPSETTTYSTFCLVPKVSPQGVGVHIGKPITNTEVYILNDAQQPVAIGVEGEIYIGGEGLSMGYLNQSDLTAEKFVSNPFKRESLLYRTGDLARYLPDGNIEYLGRTDDQVKIRGFRIELGEIESVLNQHSLVENSVVMMIEAEEGKDLVAFILKDQEEDLSIQEIRMYLQGKLPSFMIPSKVVSLDEFPLTLNGKVDKRKLRQVQVHLQFNDHAEGVLPRDLIELEIAQQWKTLLQVDRVCVGDNFFHLSGDSLKAVKLVSWMEDKFQKKYPLSLLFEYQTVEQLAELIRKRTSVLIDSRFIPLQPKGNELPFYCIHPIGGNALPYVQLAKWMGETHPFYTVQAQGLEDDLPPIESIEDMAVNYVKLLQVQQGEGPYRIGGWSFGGTVALEMARILRGMGKEVLLILFDTISPGIAAKSGGLDREDLINEFALVLMRRVGRNPKNPWIDRLGTCSEKQAIHRLWSEYREENVLPSDLQEDRFWRYYQVFRANSLAYQAYSPQIYDGEIILFRAEEQILEATRDLQRLGWENILPNLTVQPVKGDHFSIMMSTDHVKDLAKELKEGLNLKQRVKEQ